MKAAVIGLGPHGRRIVDCITNIDRLELAAVVDQSAEALAYEKLTESSAKLKSTDELWQRDDIDVVCIATNGPSHAALSEQAMNAGIRYLMVEKPMGCSIAECDQILAHARETGTRVAVDHVRRHAPIYLWLRDRIASGDWGEPRAIWIQRPGIGLGCNATHSFDAVRLITGRDVKRVVGWVDEPVGKNPRGERFVDPGGMAILELEGGARATVVQIEDGAGPNSVEIDMTAARVRLDERSGQIEVIERDLSVKPGPGRPPVFRDGEIPKDLSAATPMPVMITGCLEGLISDEPMISDGIHGRASVEILVATYLSHQRDNVPVALPLRAPQKQELWLPVT